MPLEERLIFFYLINRGITHYLQFDPQKLYLKLFLCLEFFGTGITREVHPFSTCQFTEESERYGHTAFFQEK